MRTVLCLSLVLTACVAGPTGGKKADATFPLPSGTSLPCDDLWFANGHLLVTSGLTGKAFSVTTDGVSELASGLSDPQSIDEGDGFLFVAERGTGKIVSLRPDGSRAGSASTPGIDYLRWVPNHREVWATIPGTGLETFSLGADGSLTPLMRIATSEGPEGLTLSRDGNWALVQLGTKLGIIDVAKHEVVNQFATGCSDLHGFAQFDAEGGLVFAGCREKAEVVVMKRSDGTVLSRHHVSSGATVLAWSPRLRHFYLRADPGVPVTVLGVPSSGVVEVLGTFDAANRGHAMVADPDGNLWACDANGASLLRFADSFGGTSP